MILIATRLDVNRLQIAAPRGVILGHYERTRVIESKPEGNRKIQQINTRRIGSRSVTNYVGHKKFLISIGQARTKYELCSYRTWSLRSKSKLIVKTSSWYHICCEYSNNISTIRVVLIRLSWNPISVVVRKG